VSGGIAAFVAIALIIFAILRYARTGALHGQRFTMYVVAPDAYNLLVGSDVWLNGQRVGVVRRISYNAPSAPLETRVVIQADVLRDARPLIRVDSRAELRSGGTVIGAPVVYISSGSLSAREIAPGDTLRAAGNPDLENAASRVTEAASQLPELLEDSRAVMSDMHVARERMSSLLAAAPTGRTFGASASEFMRRLTTGRGSAARSLRDTTIHGRIARSMAAMDSVRALVAGQSNGIGRFRRDSTLPRSIAQLRDDVARLRESSATSRGLARITTDSALRRSLDSAFAELNALMADVKAHPFKYGRVF